MHYTGKTPMGHRSHANARLRELKFAARDGKFVPASANESGVTFKMPMTSGPAEKSMTPWRNFQSMRIFEARRRDSW